MTSTLWNIHTKKQKTTPKEQGTMNTLVVPGQVISASPKWKAAGITLIGKGRLVKIQLHGQSIILGQVKTVVRPSGRKSHLARYLVGVCNQTKQRWEVFLEVVEDIRNKFHQLKNAIQAKLLKHLTNNLNPRFALQLIINN